MDLCHVGQLGQRCQVCEVMTPAGATEIMEILGKGDPASASRKGIELLENA